jgi:hypothetical protein
VAEALAKLSRSDFVQVFRHPLVLVFVTALVSSVLVPSITRRWQDQQAAIELRTRFASETTESVVGFLLSVQFAERGAIAQDKYTQAYYDWEVKRATLESRFAGYFADPQLAADWAAFSEAVTAAYRLSGTTQEPYRSQVIGELRTYFAQSGVDWDSLKQHELTLGSIADSQRYFSAWWSLRGAVLSRTADFARRILRSELALAR